MIRLLDLVFSLLLITLFSPFMIIAAVGVALGGPGGVLFAQVRVGRHGKPFKLLKFRTMKPNSESSGQLTIGAGDQRITRFGRWLRRYKLDELPQLFQVFWGTMSMVGPRPEVPKYVDQYTEAQRRILEMKPGITDFASLEYFDENELLSMSQDPEQTYVNEIMPAKIRLNLRYIESPSLRNYLSVIWRTFMRMVTA